MPDFGELLEATTSDASLLVLFIPSADREGDTLGKKQQKRWVRKALQAAGPAFQRCDSVPARLGHLAR